MTEKKEMWLAFQAVGESMEMPDHTEYTVEKRYKASDRNAYRSKRRLMLDEKTIFGKRKWAVKQILKKRMKPKAVAAILGVSIQTIYRWVKAAKTAGFNALKPKSKRPNSVQTISAETVKEVLDAWEEHHYGCEKLAFILGNISHMTVYRVLVRFGKIKKGKVIRRRWRFFERKHPNSMWQIDIKTISYESDLYTVSIIDDHSRFIIGCESYDHIPTTDDIVSLLEKVIAKYGIPREILTDHGAQFYANREDAVSSFDLWCDEKRIKHILAGVRKPTTIGKVERWHRTLKDELLARVADLNEFKRRLPQFIEHYNFKRPHFGYERYQVADDVWKRRKFLYIPADRYRSILVKRALI